MNIRFLSLMASGLVVLPLSAQTLSVYQSTVSSQAPAYYFTMDNNLVDAVGNTLSLTASGGGFAADYFGNANYAATYASGGDYLSSGTPIIPGSGPTGGNSTATGVGAVSLLFRTLDSTAPTGQRFLFGQGNTTANKNAFSAFFENTSNSDPNYFKLRIGDKTTSLLPPSAFAPDTWYYLAVSYNEARDSNPGEVYWYLGAVGGSLTTGTIDIGNVSVVGDNALPLVIGNSGVGANTSFRSPGNGRIDEFAIWNRELSATEVNGQFAALVSVPEPGCVALLGLGALALAWRRRC